MNKLITVSVFLLGFAFHSTAQSSIKVYANFYYLNTRITPHIPPTGLQSFNFHRPSIALSRTNKKGWIIDWEISALVKNTENVDFKIKSAQAFLRFEIGKNSWVSANKKFRFQNSVSIKTTGLKSDSSPLTMTRFPRTSRNISLNFQFFTGIEYDLTERIFLDLNTSLIGWSIGADWSRSLNPNLTLSQQKQGGFDLDALHNRLLRVGVGWKFGRKEDADQ